MKQNTKKYIKLSIILYIVILSVALIGTLAWFTFEKSVTISTEEKSKIVAGEYLEICFDDGDDDPSNDVWLTEIGVTNIAQFPDVSVSPDGTVWYPQSLDEGEKLFVGEKGEGIYTNVTNTEGYFVKLNLKVRASKGLDLFLHENSFVNGVDMNKQDAQVLTNVPGETDEFGNPKTETAFAFSKDAIAGASRVAFFVDGQMKIMWAPNEGYHLIVDETTGEIKEFKTDSGVAEEYKYLNVVDNTVPAGNEYITYKDDVANKWENNEIELLNTSNLATATENKGQTPILSFSEAGEKKLTVYIWVEGSDREANTLLSGGSLNYKLQFVGIAPKAEPTVNIENVSYDSNRLVYSDGTVAGGEILYSYDQSVWTPYNATNPDLAKENTVLYIRTKETATEKLGAIKEIPLS